MSLFTFAKAIFYYLLQVRCSYSFQSDTDLSNKFCCCIQAFAVDVVHLKFFVPKTNRRTQTIQLMYYFNTYWCLLLPECAGDLFQVWFIWILWNICIASYALRLNTSLSRCVSISVISVAGIRMEYCIYYKTCCSREVTFPQQRTGVINKNLVSKPSCSRHLNGENN